MGVLDNPVAVLVALVGAGGVGGLFREIVVVLVKLRSGVSAKEANRKKDLVSERDFEYDRAEAYRRNFQRLDEAFAELRVYVIDRGIPKASLPDRPRLEKIPDRAPGSPVTSRS